MAHGLGGIGGGVGTGLSMPLELLKNAPAAKPDGEVEKSGASSFADVLKNKLTDLNAQQVDANNASQDVASGRVDDIAQTMLRIEQANVSLQMTTQVRNKVIEAYQEIMRMQV